MASADKRLEEQLLEAGNKLANPPSSAEELLSLLEQVESCLSRVEQSPTVSMQNALSPSLKAMVGDQLLRHSDNDVKVSVASCISEITRISAPDAPYDDDQMKEVFHLIVSSLENLHDKLSRSYVKRISILETVAKVRSCVVMLDLECDALISDMFQHFLKGVREHHPENVVLSMETIMTVVVEESEDISLALLSPLLDSIKKDNEEAFPIAQKLGERVLENCATKLKPYLVQTVRSLGVSVDDYSAVLALICQDTSDDLEKNDTCVTSEHAEDKSDSEKQSLEKSTHVVKKDSREVTSSQRGNPDANKSPNSGMSYGIACVGEDTALAYSSPIKKKEDADCSNHSEGLNISGHEVGSDLDTKKVDNSKQKAGKATKRPRKKSSSSTKLAKPSKDQVAANEKEAVKMLDCESNSKIVPSSPHKEHFVEVAGPSDSNKEMDAKISSPVAVNDESEVVASAPSESLNDENRLKKLGRSTKEDDSVKEGAAYDVSKVAGGASDSEAKPVTRSVKKALGQKSLKKTSVVDSVKKESGAINNADAKKYSAKKLEENKKGSGGSSSRQAEDRKKGGRGKAKTETDVAKSSAMNVDKEIVTTPRSCTKSAKDASSEETPKANVKRKLTSGKENEYGTKECGENLVGLRVKVWWPKDREFYKGIIDSFDSAKKKHKVSYDDGDEEILNLGKEKWKVIDKDSDADEEDRSDRASLDASIDMQPKKKGKTSDGETTKQGKMDVSSKSGGIKTNSRSKSVSLKSSQRSKDGNKLKDSMTNSKSGDGVNKKSKEDTPKSSSSKSIVATKILSKKSKNTDTSRTGELNDDYSSVPKPSSKSKLEILKSGKSKKTTPKTAVSKEKPLKSGGKADVNGTGKVKSDLLKIKYFENDNSDVSEGKLKDAKVKTSISSKAQGSKVKSGKKRRRS
ncbi:sister chromatid cohesion protein PDS5 homolog C-like isoform X1 [Vigna umbellata]|uniref:sister chromatid cohesion protein PDS5 homolog C-like isoform X1 n=1 Tax=Vigna umbellata TaxID=87088 RepID=UPI001F5EE068|nr:sister chromatid cohesion protein PDS5 homolog C-like isoform X1 [Vigna umbellata]